MESRPGAIRELATELQNGGYTVTLEPYNSFDIWNNFFDMAISRLQMTVENFWKQYVTATLYTPSTAMPVIKPADGLRNTCVSVPDGPKKTPALVPNTGSSGNPRNSASTSSAKSQGTANRSTFPSGTLVPPQAVPVASSQVTAATSSNPSNVTIPSSGDFIHVCFKVKRYFKLRHDLLLTQVSKDRELFTNLREAYAANFSWAHRNLSIWTVQKINYVRVRDSYCSERKF
ncbi:uncharacterized protein J4E92_006217 [Alternaria infectoria]|uniref:uncharacterized protein n=1 Tax=Alternaria infectoria TaxID=45303 RepID=UPI002220B02C|nr:uncharacterized protein J4E92_006217 [Alternaria infectoria]KAI4927053.1 hypothetical protein J4E92_006217 [Alternaria infectoria]